MKDQVLDDEQVVEAPKYNLNQIRTRATRLPEITTEEWNNLDINKDNREIVDEFLKEGCRNLSPKTVKQYKSALRIFAKFVLENSKNLPFYKITRRGFLKYQNWLLDNGLSSSGVRLKRAAISSLLKYCETIVAEEDDDWAEFKNFMNQVDPPVKTKTYEKIPITEEEFKKMKKFLLENKRYRDYAIVVTLMRTGMRIGELRQLKLTESEKEIPTKKKFIRTDVVRGKGRGVDGKAITYILTREVLAAIRLWVKHRRDTECEYLFVSESKKGAKQISENYFSTVCTRYLVPLCERRINPHLFRGSAATHFLEQGLDIKSVKKILNHESVETTSSFYDLRDEDDMLEEEFNKML